MGFYSQVYCLLFDELVDDCNVLVWDMWGYGVSVEVVDIKIFCGWEMYYEDFVVWLESLDEFVWFVGYLIGVMISIMVVV